MKIKRSILLIALALLAIGVAALLVIVDNQAALRINSLLLINKVVEHLRSESLVWPLYVGTITLAIHYLRQRRWVASTIVFCIGLLWLGYYGSTVGFIFRLGSDSFDEARAFDINEAMFWLQTFATQVQFSLKLKAFVLYSVLALGFCAALHYASLGYRPLRSRFHVLQPVVASIIIAVALYKSVGGTAENIYRNKLAFENLVENFKNDIPSAKTSENINVLLYVGESTSVMNMSLYGYSRNTTPLLSKLEQTDESLLKFENVFSTHTHTSPSLLEALSIGLHRNEDKLPITDRRRISIVDILNEAGVGTELYSNQGRTGTWDVAGSIIFKNAVKTVFSADSKAFGNAGDGQKKPWDDKFFHAQLRTEDLDKKSSALVVFHSYAGHGGYASNIPPAYRGPVDDSYQQLNQTAITGYIRSLESVEEYDSAIKYIDFSVYGAIDILKNSKQPWVFLYFSDHGEAVFTSRSHDSSRFIHEMARVPFVIYFNAAAQAAYPDLFQKYTRLSKTKNIGTLAQLPRTLFDLLGVAIDPTIGSLEVIGASTTPLPIVIRHTADGITAVNLSSQPLDNPLIDRSDAATRHFVSSNSIAEDMPVICYHRSNTIAKALRGSLVTNCLEIDIMVDENGKALAYHPPAKNTGLSLKDIFAAVKSNQKLAFWLDGKNLNSRKTCDDLHTFLAEETPPGSMGVLVEFPTGSHKVANEVADCLGNLIKADLVHTSYYVPTGIAVDCSRHLSFGQDFEETASCKSLQAELAAVKETELFTDISFDFRGIRAVEELDFLSSMSWNAWHVTSAELDSISPARFRMIILKNDDPNNM